MTYETAYQELQQILQRVDAPADGEVLSLSELEAQLRRAAELLAFCKAQLHEIKTKDLLS
jgi:exonuclease VII small subunit